jgi:hypothetical protein
MRRSWAVAAGALTVAAVAAVSWVAVEVSRPESGCGCAIPPQVEHLPATAGRWLDAVRSGDAPAAWAMLTPDAQRRHGDVDRFRAELPELASRFGTAAGRWQEVDLRTQGAGTPTDLFLVRVTGRDGVAAAPAGLVVHSRATLDDPGRIDPDLGEPVRVSAADPGAAFSLPGTVRVANPDGRDMDFLGVPLAAPPERARLDLAPVRDLGDGTYRIDANAQPELSGAGLLVVTVKRPDGRHAFGAVPATFG